MPPPAPVAAADVNALDAHVAMSTAHLIDGAFLQASVQVLVERIGAHIAFITRALDHPATRVEVVACSEPAFPTRFDLAGTPCELVYAGAPVAICEDLARRFEPARPTGCESFHGYPFFDKRNRCIGHLGLFFREHTVLPDQLSDWLEKLAGRLEAELTRLDMQTQLQSAQRMLEFQNRVLQMASRQEPLDQVLEAIIVGIEAEHDDMLCSIMCPDASGKVLTLCAAPSLPAEYVFAVHEVPIASGAGSCGSAAFTRERVVATNIAEHPYWENYKHLALPHGLQCCWSQPILGKDRRLLGVFAIYQKQPSEPDPESLDLIESLSALTSLVLDLYDTTETLRQKSLTYANFLRMASDGIAILDGDGRIVEVSDRFVEQIGAASRKEMMGQRIWEWDLSTNEGTYRRRIANLAQHPTTYETTHRRPDGETRHAEFSAAAFKSSGQTMVWMSMRDISERKRLEAALLHRASTDELTGIANRGTFLTALAAEFARSQRHQRSLSVMMIDIDHFKSVNDRHGHAAGDAVLRSAASAWRNALRQEDMIGRMGGEEFAVVLPETGASGAAQLAERMRLCAAHLVTPLPDALSPGIISFTCSIGFATLDGCERDHEELLARADMALLEAKSRGRNRVHCAPPPDSDIL